MPVSIPASHRDLFEKPNFGHLATLMPDGSPQVTPVWVDIEGDTIIFNTAEGRVKTRNLDRDGRVAISVADQQNPYRYIQVRGRVVSRTRDGADAHIDKLAKKYLGQDRYPFRQPGEQRVIYRIQPEHVQVNG
ncbi:PPOX class F420-dependent oxidoreductase [Tepidiforma sp.]|uniref:PPOX class F420-dependent oxidoreductase n=1 Tax=Tepidiforma sp. TaxID=2682230 RepID=UPI00260BF880|nr:PPOX class F420-dependent oxidoreductase [Tepidiforma sp.]MCX7617928.1 PPOX class F420-dependent oxidoreductase [Tepidiforma sp.]